MQIARPRDGFRIVEPDTIARLIETADVQHPGVAGRWAAIKERLKFTTHRDEDSRAVRGDTTFRVFTSMGDDEVPAINVVYRVLGDTVTLKMARVGR